ncbi:MAG: aminotransferase class I/II-fold pyridoxal phosphate-dependent enzyme, partial [Cyanobacteria bacterium HKST-UBA05]|nr:aminotransferase class I/II-fold pyridoxal phosphate-dependent enzyme [Cyanobacteria bacterium HKST-UBA05]
MPSMPLIQPAQRASGFGESVIRETTRLARRYGATNLAQGLPDLPAPQRLKDLAKAAIDADHNQYAFTWGLKELRDAIARKHAHFYNQAYDPETEVVVCCGSSEAIVSAMLAFVAPGDEVIIFEPIYENYIPATKLCSAVPVFVSLRQDAGSHGAWVFDEAELRAAFSNKTRAIILNTPNNPTGKVFGLDELGVIAALCQQYNVLCLTDEIYEHMVYDGARHIPMVTLDGMADRTLTITGFSKTFCVTGWRTGYAVGCPALINPVRKVHDYATIAAPTPQQVALARFLDETLDDPSFYTTMVAGYDTRRKRLTGILRQAGFTFADPAGAYYVFADYRH